jgi:hypothetical protein
MDRLKASPVAPPRLLCLLVRRPVAEFLVSWHSSTNRVPDAVMALSILKEII